jgi:hypothetical protein
MSKEPRMNANTRESRTKADDGRTIGVHWRSFAVTDFFPPRPTSRPTVYAQQVTNPQYAGLLKVTFWPPIPLPGTSRMAIFL